ncbi:MAG: DNA-deoxyinosine glycosylase [Mariprofundaceae bacterium]|nr:DNA-deoxyinosine glycosylase [Mariprofundaceae bacterium]
MLTGFPFCADKDAHVLILGSMPGRKSLAEQQYYAHPRNGFWPMVGELFGFEAALPYEKRLELLKNNNIALWDVAHQCQRPGSLDTDIREVKANDFKAFFASYKQIRHVFFNGRKAESLFLNMVQPHLTPEQQKLTKYLLPSSSPAYAAVSFAEKLTAWKIIRMP